MKKHDLILTTVHRLGSEPLKPFFLSLRKTGYEGDVVVFASAVDDASVSQLKELGARVVPFHFRGKHVTNGLARPWFLWKRIFASNISLDAKERIAKRILHLFYLRHLLYLQFLRSHRDEYSRVFLTDCRDVFFQAAPFSWNPEPGLHVFLEEESNKVGQCVHHIRWIGSQFGKKTLEALAGETVSCAGTVIGDTEAIMQYTQSMVACAMRANSLRHADGDQGIHNYLIRERMLDNVTLHANRRGPVITLGPIPMSDLTLNESGLVLSDEGKLIPILHQYDRNAELTKKLLAFAGLDLKRTSQ